MKILTSLVGLILFLGGIYLTYLVFLDFESFETLMLGLYLAGSFISMTLGFFLFLLPFTSKTKQSKLNIEDQFAKNETQLDDTMHEHETISDTDAIRIIRDESNHENLNITQEIKQNSLNLEIDQTISKPLDSIKDSFDTHLNHEDSHDQDLIEIIKNESNNEFDLNPTDIELEESEDIDEPINEESTLKPNIDEVFDKIEMRVIGIDTWSSQNIIKKLDENSILDLNHTVKSGINMTQVLYNKKLIGYISRLDINKVNDRMNDLRSVNPCNIVKDGRKIAYFSVNLKFKQREQV